MRDLEHRHEHVPLPEAWLEPGEPSVEITLDDWEETPDIFLCRVCDLPAFERSFGEPVCGDCRAWYRAYRTAVYFARRVRDLAEVCRSYSRLDPRGE